MKLNAVDLSAKLLATENITVVRSRVRTASFDIKSRVLTLPQWKEMTPLVEGMLVGHEVGHALYTDEAYLKPIQDNRKLMSYLNVLEDVRIEKLLKRKYPGIRKTMNEGYKELNDKDFFGINKIPDLGTLNLIDRINLYYKAGYSCGVQFSMEEKMFVLRAEKTETVDDVVALANDVYTFSKEQAEKRRQEAKQNGTELDEEDEQDELDDMEAMDDMFIDSSEMDEGDADGESDSEGFNDGDMENAGRGRTNLTEEQKEEIRKEKEQQEIEQELESQTEKVFSEKLEELADEDTEYMYYTLDEKYCFNPIVDYKTILSETTEVEEMINEHTRKELASFKVDSSRVVNYLIKEFEMRKSAAMYKRAQTSKIGSLDMKKIWGYQLNDDLFKRVTTINKGKNHGMIFLLDWSGSMDYVLDDTVKQVINLAMFCQRAQIPYQVFAFSSQYNNLKTDEDNRRFNDRRREFFTQDKVLSNAVSQFALLEFFSSKMSNVEFNTMVRRIISTRNLRYVQSNDYGTGGTPLNEALGYVAGYLAKFSKANNTEKLSLITLTDGDGAAMQTGAGRYLEEYRWDRNYNKKINMKHFLQDPVTKKTYELNRYSPYQTEAILRLIKDRYGVNSVGFYICRNAKRDLEQAIKSNLPGFNGSHYSMIESMRREFRDKGFASIKNTGRDDLFIVPQNKLIVEEGELVVDEKQNARQIAKNFGKMMGGRKSSRVLLNQFIQYVA